VANLDETKTAEVVSALESAIRELTKAEKDFADQALSRPAGKSEFDFGHSCGMYQGLKLSRSILEHALEERDPKSRRLDDDQS
jgi:hypothetical protein